MQNKKVLALLAFTLYTTALAVRVPHSGLH